MTMEEIQRLGQEIQGSKPAQLSEREVLSSMLKNKCSCARGETSCFVACSEAIVIHEIKKHIGGE